jgi:hypothetical protein
MDLKILATEQGDLHAAMFPQSHFAKNTTVVF